MAAVSARGVVSSGARILSRGPGKRRDVSLRTLDEKFATPALKELVRGGSGEVKEIVTWLLMSQATPEALQELSQLNTASLSAKAIASVKALREKPDLLCAARRRRLRVQS